MSTVRLALRGSRALAAAILTVHAGAALAIAIAVPGRAAVALAWLVFALGAAAAWDRALLRGARSARALEVGEDGALRVQRASGAPLEARPGGRRHVSPWWVVLPVKGWARSVVVAADMLGPEEFRRLRLWALWGRVPGAGPRAPSG